MAEILGVVASVVQLAGTAATISLVLYDCGHTIANAKSELDSLAGDVFDLSTVLELLVEILGKCQDRLTIKPMKVISDLVTRCNKVLEELKITVNLTMSKANYFKWLFRRSKTLELKLSLEGFKSNIGLIIQTVTLASSIEADLKRQTEVQKRNMSAATQRNINLLRNAVLGNRNILNDLRHAESDLTANKGAENEDEIASEETFKQDLATASAPHPNDQILWLGAAEEMSWQKVLFRSYRQLCDQPPSSKALRSAIPREAIATRIEASCAPTSTSMEESTAEFGSIKEDADREIIVLLQEWTETSLPNIEACFKAEQKDESVSFSAAPVWANEDYEFAGYDPSNPNHWQKKSTNLNDVADELDLLPYSRFAYEAESSGASSLCNVLAREGGSWVWRHDCGWRRDYYVGKKKVIQYFIEPYRESFETHPAISRTIVGKQWISEEILQNSGYPFRSYGEGSYAIEQKLTPDEVEVLHISSSDRTELLLRRLAKQRNGSHHDGEAKKPTVTTDCIALLSFQSSNDDEISFEPGDILQVEGDLNATWVTARFNGQKGMIPGNYVRIIDEVELEKNASQERAATSPSAESNPLSGTTDELSRFDKWKKRFDRMIHRTAGMPEAETKKGQKAAT